MYGGQLPKKKNTDAFLQYSPAYMEKYTSKINDVFSLVWAKDSVSCAVAMLSHHDSTLIPFQ